MLLSYLGLGGRHGDVYLENGGGMTLASYGVPARHARAGMRCASLPADHLDFFRSLPPPAPRESVPLRARRHPPGRRARRSEPRGPALDPRGVLLHTRTRSRTPSSSATRRHARRASSCRIASVSTPASCTATSSPASTSRAGNSCKSRAALAARRPATSHLRSPPRTCRCRSLPLVSARFESVGRRSARSFPGTAA